MIRRALLAILLLCPSAFGALTPAQLQALKADIAADATLSPVPNSPDGNQSVADAYNAAAGPAWYVWRTNVSEAEYTGLPGVDVAGGNAQTVWSWPAVIARSTGEQNGWMRMFATGSVNPSRANVRQGFADIFSGTQNNAPAQRNHLTVLSKRTATRAEKLFSSGAGSYASPATLSFEGTLTYSDVTAARNSP
jgi:hypothetical protein